MKQPRASDSVDQSAGFSLIELIVVLSISVVLAAIAIPQVISSVRSSRIQDAATGLSGLVQQARILAEQNNVTLPVYTGTVQNSATGAFVPCITITSPTNCPSGGNGTSYLSNDPSVPYAGDVVNGAAASAPGTLSPGFTPATGTLYFSPRGMTVSGVAGALTNGTVLYLTDGANDWAAVSVSSIGKTKVWMWNGKTWQ